MKIHCGFAAFFLVLGCSSQSSNSSGGSTSVLAGTWSSSCGGEGESASKYVLVVSGSTIKRTETVYSTTNCAAGSEQYIFRSEATLSIGGAASAPEGATKLDLTNERYFITLKSDAAVSQYNADVNSGFKDWVKDRERDVTEAITGGAPGSPGRTYTIFKITGNTVCLGASDGEFDGSTDAKRKNLLETGNGCLTR